MVFIKTTNGFGPTKKEPFKQGHISRAIIALNPNSVNSLDFPTISIFLLIPILTIVAVLITDFLFKNKSRNKTLDIDSLIKEMEELSSKA